MIVEQALWFEQLRQFAATTDPSKSFLALDLDGTALLEDRGKVFISSSVEKGVRCIHDHNMPVVLNTLRFPLSVITTVGEAWYQIADVPILTVLLNGSLLGYIKCIDGALHYEELAAFTLTPQEIRSMVEGIAQLCKAGIENVLFFYYSRDWKEGETLWTPQPEKVADFEKKTKKKPLLISAATNKNVNLAMRELLKFITKNRASSAPVDPEGVTTQGWRP